MKTKGREDCFKCCECGKYVSYDRRKTIIKHTRYWNGFYEDVEEDIEVYHKKCYAKPKSQNNVWAITRIGEKKWIKN